MSGRVLVTGGSAGLGAAIAARAVADGNTVVSVDIRPPASFDGIVHVDCDLSNRDAVDRALTAILAAGPYTQVYFNAGASATGRFEEIPAGIAEHLMRLNAETPMILASTLVREAMISGAICFVSSLSHFTGYPGAAAYAASKDALAVYAKSVRKPFAARGISVTLACPGPIRTGHAERHAPQGADPKRRMTADEAAVAIVTATCAGRRLVIPGMAPKLFALASCIAPGMVIRQMRKLVYDKLEGPVW